MIKSVGTPEQVEDVIATPYDGCGKCMVAVRRLSRKTEKTNSPAKQAVQVAQAVTAFGGHIVGWADDWEVSGATDPLTRPGFGPWLRGEMGPYDGIAGAAVDRIGRNVRDILNTAHANHEAGRVLITADHVGVWDLGDPNQENELVLKAMGAQMEHRSIRTRNRDETRRARDAGQKKNAPAYGFEFVRLTPNGKVDHQKLNKIASANARDIAHRILTDETGTVTPATEAARLTRAAVPSPEDHRRVMYGNSPKGMPWTPKTVRHILTSEASLGLLTHKGRSVVGSDGHPVKLSEGLWSAETRRALVAKVAPRRKQDRARAPKGDYRLSGVAFCGVCRERLYVAGTAKALRWSCTARVRGVVSSQHCKPAPSTYMSYLDAHVEEWLLARHGDAQVMEKQFIVGTRYGERIAELEADRRRLREDRMAHLYDDPDDAEWFRREYKRMGDELKELRQLPERPSGVHLLPTGETVAQQWHSAVDESARRLILAGLSVRMELFPERAPERVTVTGVNPFAGTA